MAISRVLFLTDRSEHHQRTALDAAPPELEVLMKRTPSPDELATLLPQIDIIISERNQPVTAEMIAQARRLRLILRLGSLYHDIDVAAARRAGVRVSVQPVLGSIYCAEHALMMILAVVKRLGRSLFAANAADHGMPARRTDENVFAFDWLGYRDVGGLIGKTVSILGMGEIGAELARMLRGMRPDAVFYFKRTPYPPAAEQELGIRLAASLDQLIQVADILVSLLPFGPETDYRHGGGLTAERLALLKPGAMLVHLGSGSVIEERAVVASLRAGRLGGAAFDTYEYEPLQPDNPLVTLARDPDSNLLLTPHTAAAWAGSDRTGDYAEIRRFLAGEPLQHAVP
jgi:phosphoglycerate dehydrogenase-like enzyme